MDNKKVTATETTVKESSAGRVVHLTAAIILLALATLAVIITMSFASEFFSLRAMQDAEVGPSNELSNGLGQAFSIVFALIFGVAAMALSVISLVLSSTVWRYRTGGVRVFGIIATVISIVYIVGLIATFVAILAVTR